MVLVGGGYLKFDEYIPKNHRAFQRKMVAHMMNSSNSLQWVCQQLIDGKNITAGKFYAISSPISGARKSARTSAISGGKSAAKKSPLNKSKKNYFKSPTRQGFK